MYDMIFVGGGVASATLAKLMAAQGARVLVLERQQIFRDRVRGEAILPWGVVEARALGIYESLLHNCGQELRWWLSYNNGKATERRDLIASTPHQTGCITCYHPTLQTVLLKAAEHAGAEVRRGMTVVDVCPGTPATVYVQNRHHTTAFKAQVVVGADGRTSHVRRWAGFAVQHAPDRLVIASVLHKGLHLSENAVHEIAQPNIGQAALIFPIGQQRFRSYFMYRKQASRRGLSGKAHVEGFIRACVETGALADWYKGAVAIGPLAEFEGAAMWVDHPYRDGVVLLGDAAAASDPSFGTGLALTLRDVRVLWTYLRDASNWEEALDAYAAEHDKYFGALNRITGWWTDIFYEIGPEAEARRAYVMACHRAEPSRGLDLLALGPDAPSDEAARQRFFAED